MRKIRGKFLKKDNIYEDEKRRECIISAGKGREKQIYERRKEKKKEEKMKLCLF